MSKKLTCSGDNLSSLEADCLDILLITIVNKLLMKNIISLSQAFYYLKHLQHFSFKHLSISNISLSQTSLYLKHRLFLSNFCLSRTSLYLKHPSVSNIPLSRTSLYLELPSISIIVLFLSSISLSQASNLYQTPSLHYLVYLKLFCLKQI